MDSSPVKVKTGFAWIALLLTTCYIFGSDALSNTYHVHDSTFSFRDPDFQSLEAQMRYKRDAPTLPSSPTVNTTTTTTPGTVTPPANDTDSNRTIKVTSPGGGSPAPATSVTQVPLLGQNGTGQLHVDVNAATSAKVSEPIDPDDNITNVFRDTTTLNKAEQNLTNGVNDTHSFYNSTFIVNKTYFDEYWASIDHESAETHTVLSNSHRRATTVKLRFDFPFYGHPVKNITVATGGFIYTGEHVHNWLAATQYIAPLMANFDTTMTNDSSVKMLDDGKTFSAIWENVTLQGDTTKKFTFAVSLYNNGDIVFAYKDIPVLVQDINDRDHPVKVGISDAYLTDRIVFLVRRKTIYEYHRVNFKDHSITSNTILRLTALPTCLQYDTCDTCVNHDTGFNCMWCESIHKCSSGTDRNKQDWMLRNCDKAAVNNETSCPARTSPPPAPPAAPANTNTNAATANTAYVTDANANVDAHAEVNTIVEQPGAPPQPQQAERGASSQLGGAVAAFAAVALVCSLAAWTLYAFKNPHTRSGQLLIKYRPSQWTWRRGEARYTAATIHM